MATLEQLVASGHLLRHEADSESWELPNRCVFYPPTFAGWCDSTLQAVPKKRGRDLSPYEQAEQILYDFVTGEPMAYSIHYRKLEPYGFHIWELKTPDVRIFGWFVRKGHFVAVCGELKDNLTKAKSYAPFIEEVKNFRDKLDLDTPKALTEVNYNAVL